MDKSDEFDERCKSVLQVVATHDVVLSLPLYPHTKPCMPGSIAIGFIEKVRDIVAEQRKIET